MNLAGCQEAWATDVTVEVSEGLSVRCASLPALSLLKLMAWADRGAETSRDAEDLLIIFREYLGAGNGERIYDDLPEALPGVLGHDPNLMAAALLVQDIRKLASPDSLERVLALLNEPESRRRLLGAMLRAAPYAEERTTQLMEALCKGMRTL